MRSNITLLVILAFSGCFVSAQSVQKTAVPASLAEALNFEGGRSGNLPQGWTGGPAGTVFVDDKIVHGGQRAARLERTASSPEEFSALSQSMEIDFAGATLELRGFLRTRDVSGFGGLWMREDGEIAGIAFDNMQSRQLKGTTEWKEYSIQLPIHPEAQRLSVGVLISGTGAVWADDLQLLVDGKPIWEAPKAEKTKTAIDLDHEFDAGSGIGFSGLTRTQIDNLALLGKVWGFLKYHHPLVTSGKKHWDYELFRILPSVMNAPGRAAANDALSRWIASLGTLAACNPCAKLNADDLYLRPDVDWISDEKRLGADLSHALRSIYDSRPAKGQQFYVSVAEAGNPAFRHELAYERFRFPDPAFRLLAVYRFWNIVQYWFPYRDVLGEDWDKVLVEFIPRIVAAQDADAYQREMMALIARIHDTHANLWSSLEVRPPVGGCRIPVTLRFVENQAVVTGNSVADSARAAGGDTGLKIGDVITELDGVPVAALVKNWAPLYAASNDPTRLRDIAASMTRGECTEANLGILRGTQKIKLRAKRVPSTGPGIFITHDLPGDTFRLLSDNIAYVKLSSVKAAEAVHYVEASSAAKGLIIDIRNYPSEFVVFALGSLLVDRETPFARFTTCDLSSPGAFRWGPTETLAPKKPRFPGKIVVLVDETSQSSAEYTSMAFRSAPNALVVGSTTAGADGNVSRFALPGGFNTMISGIGVFYPNKAPTQRIGIIPDVEAKPTIAGIRAGRDEVLEEAIRQILGPSTPSSEIQKISRPSSSGTSE